MKRVKDIVDYALNNGKLDEQFHQAHEELCELGVAINHARRYDDCESIAEVITEIADVLVMVEQLKLIFDIGDEEIEQEVDYKIKRQLRRIANEE